MGDILKANVLTFAGMSEDAVMGLPPDARTMVMTGTNALMNAQAQGGPGPGPNGPAGGGPPPGMMNGMGPGMGHGQMPMEMGQMHGMGMGMNGGDLGMMMQEGMANSTPEMAGHIALPEGMPPGMPVMGMGINMNHPDFAAMQVR